MEKTATLPVLLVNNPEHISAICFLPRLQRFLYRHHILMIFIPMTFRLLWISNDLKHADNKRNKLKIVNNKPYISNIRIQPEDVEILLEEK